MNNTVTVIGWDTTAKIVINQVVKNSAPLIARNQVYTLFKIVITTLQYS